MRTTHQDECISSVPSGELTSVGPMCALHFYRGVASKVLTWAILGWLLESRKPPYEAKHTAEGAGASISPLYSSLAPVVLLSLATVLWRGADRLHDLRGDPEATCVAYAMYSRAGHEPADIILEPDA